MKTLLRTLALITLLVLVVGTMSLAAGCAKDDAKTDTPAADGPATDGNGTDDEGEQPALDGEEVLAGACTQCHDTTRILIQPEMTDWTAIISEMETAHGAVLTDEEKTAVAEFLESREPDKGEEIIAGKCTTCHDVTRIYSQPDGTNWEGIMTKMVEVHGAVLTPEEQAAVIEYLEAH
jgi:cytochrome c5